MYSCSYGINSVVLLKYFSYVMVLIGLYSCLLFRVCNAYADSGLSCFVYLISFSIIRNFTYNTMFYTFNDIVYIFK